VQVSHIGIEKSLNCEIDFEDLEKILNLTSMYFNTLRAGV